METFLELIREVLKGIVSELTAHLFRRNVLNKKTTSRRRKQKGGSQKYK